jgi:hypothetical protein
LFQFRDFLSADFLSGHLQVRIRMAHRSNQPTVLDVVWHNRCSAVATVGPTAPPIEHQPALHRSGLVGMTLVAMSLQDGLDFSDKEVGSVIVRRQHLVGSQKHHPWPNQGANNGHQVATTTCDNDQAGLFSVCHQSTGWS